MFKFSEDELKRFSKEELIFRINELYDDYEELENNYNNLDDEYGEMEERNCDLQTEVDNLNDQVEYVQELVDMEDLKEKLEFYDLKSEKLWNFLDLYMKLYNK